MAGFALVELRHMLSEMGEERCSELLSQFSCPLNKDVESFLKRKAILFQRQGIANTFLVYASYQGTNVLVGYFSLANKHIRVSKKSLSSSLRTRIKKFATYDKDLDEYGLTASLIGQLGKNFANGYNNLITGDELMFLALKMVRMGQMILSGKIVYLECEDIPKLIDFYKDHGFVCFGTRDLERDERDDIKTKYLVQMLKYFDDKDDRKLI